MPKNKKSIWYVNQYAVTPKYPGGTRHYDFALELSKEFKVTVLTSGFNNFNKKETQNYQRNFYKIEKINNNLDFIWIKSRPYKKNELSRILNIFLFSKNLEKIAKLIKKPDMIIGSSPNLIVSHSAYRIAKKMKIPFVFEVRDIWPDLLIELGINKFNPLIEYFQFLEKSLMNKSDKIIGLMPYFDKYAKKKFNIESKKIEWISNGVADQYVRKPIKPNTKKFIVTYAGTIGVAQNFEIIIEAAKELKNYKAIRFLIIGDGVKKQQLEKKVKDKNLPNIIFKKSLSKKNVFKLLRSSNVLLFTQRKADIYAYGQPPNKIFDYMAAGRPVIFASIAKNNLVRESGCGITINPESTKELAMAVIKLYDTKEKELARMGANGQKFVKNHYLISKLSRKIKKIIDDLA